MLKKLLGRLSSKNSKRNEVILTLVELGIDVAIDVLRQRELNRKFEEIQKSIDELCKKK